MSRQGDWRGSIESMDAHLGLADGNSDEEHASGLGRTPSSSSTSGLMPSDANDDLARRSTVRAGMRQLFMGSTRQKKQGMGGIDDSSDLHSVTSAVTARPSRSPRPQLTRSNSAPHIADADVSLRDTLLDPENFTVIKAGLNEALGSNGKGSWLAVDDGSGASMVNSASNASIADDGQSSYNKRNSGAENIPLSAMNSEYRGYDMEDRESHIGNRRSFSPTRNRQPGLQISSMVQGFSARVVANAEHEQGHQRSRSTKGSRSRSRIRSEYEPEHYTRRDSLESLHNHGFEQDPKHEIFAVDTEVDSDVSDESRGTQPLLCGRSMRLFSPQSRLRQSCVRFLDTPYLEPLLLVLIIFQTVILAYVNWSNVNDQPHSLYKWGRWTDWSLLVIFVAYTVETVAKVIAYGLWDDSQLFNGFDNMTNTSGSESSLFQKESLRASTKKQAPVIIKTFASFGSGKTSDRAERAYLRSSWNRVDFISVVTFWISLVLNASGVENNHKFFALRVLSNLRILRLLNLTRGTSAVLRALKKATPLLANVAVFIAFFWMLFSIVGVQSFKSSLRRTCVWVDPEGIQPNFTAGQFCGSYLHPTTFEVLPYVFTDGSSGPQAKGYTCPANSVCVSDKNPYGNTLSFDNVFNSFEIVFVIMSANTFSDILYDTTYTDYLVAALFFMAGIIVLYVWLMNLIIAIIVSSFELVREELRAERPSFWKKMFPQLLSGDGGHYKYLLRTWAGRWYHKTRWVWGIVIFTDLIMQATITSLSTWDDRQLRFYWSVGTTGVLTFDIVLRFCLYLPYWRAFFQSKVNVLDLFLAVVNILIVMPYIYDNEELYAWMTIFQIARFYRVALGISFVRHLWLKVLGNTKTVLNLAVFFFLLIFLSSILSTQLFRGVIPYTDDDGNVLQVSFFDLANAFVGMYQITSTENWTSVMYPAVQFSPSKLVAVCFVCFFIIWYIFSNFIVLNLFVAVITENLDVSPQLKRRAQIKAFVKEYAEKMNKRNYLSHGIIKVRKMWTEKFRRRGSDNSEEQEQIYSGDGVFELLLEKQVVDDFLDKDDDLEEQEDTNNNLDMGVKTRWFTRAWKWWFKTRRSQRKGFNPFLDEMEIQQNGIDPTNFAQDYVDAQRLREQQQQDYLVQYPNYDRSMILFKHDNKIRRFCQKVFPASYGIRPSGVNPEPAMLYGVQTLMFALTVALVVVACVNTPLYYRNYVLQHGYSANSWITYVDLFFVCVFTVEAAMKIIADGFIFTPNAYFRSSWNKIDWVVLVTLWINFVSEAFFNGYVSRFVRCFEALRALRLLSISSIAQETFHSVFIVGARKIVGAAMISMTLLFPFTIWGLNLFNGKLSFCNDGDLVNFTQCNGEYMSSPFNWDVLAPRAIEKQYFDYDTFGHAFLVQFGVISLEGWIDVLNAVMAITGRGTNPIPFAARRYGIFPILYNFLSTLFILSMFIAVIIRNYSETRGTAYLTDEQLEWYETERMLKLVKPSRRPPYRKPGSWRAYLLNQSQNPKSWMNRMELVLLSVLVILLCLEYYPAPEAENSARSGLLLVTTFLYELISVLKSFGLGWKLFSKRAWDVYALFVTTCAFTFTLTAEIGGYRINDIYYNFQKSFLVGMLLLWIPKSERLDQLCRTASASFVELGNLLLTWFILFLGYAIAFNQVFGLARIGPNGSINLNFRTVPKSLIVLFRMSFGEGWNQLLNDFLIDPPTCVSSGSGFIDSDCGSHTYAYILFISWNVISMYIFVNMFISLIYDNFSYVFHKSQSDISKDDIHLFKQAWLRFDPDGTGYIARQDLEKLLRATDGYFSMRIYDGRFTVHRILSDARIEFDKADPYAIDREALNATLRHLPAEHYKRQRYIYDTFCAQALLEAHPLKGISFNNLIRQFPFYKSVADTRCLKLDDYLKRKMLMQKVEVELQKRKIVGFLNMVNEHNKLKAQVAADRHRSAAVSDLLGPAANFNGLPVINVIGTPGDSQEDLSDTRGRPERRPDSTSSEHLSVGNVGSGYGLPRFDDEPVGDELERPPPVYKKLE